MNLFRCLALLLMLPGMAPVCGAGAFHRCDDGSGTPIYQSLPCAAGARTLERREYVDAAAPTSPRESQADRRAGRASRVARVTTAADTGGRTSRTSRIAAYACSRGGSEWIQDQPCKSDDTGPARQRAITRDELCRKVKDGSHRSASGERASDSTYARNRFRENAGC